MRVYCHRKLDGRFLVETVAGDTFEYQATARGGEQRLRLVGPPHWRVGPWPSDGDGIATAARQAAVERARGDGLSV